MAKKSRSSRRGYREQNRKPKILQGTESRSVQAPSPVKPVTPAKSVAPRPDDNERYTSVRTELKRIGIIGVSIILVIIVIRLLWR